MEGATIAALALLVVALAVAPVLSSGSTGWSTPGAGHDPATAPDPVVPAGEATGSLGTIRGGLHPADLLVVSDAVLPRAEAASVAGHDAVARVHPLGLASVVVAGRSVSVAAADPATYRAFTDRRTARTRPVWEAVARGELALTHALAGDLGLVLGGQVPLGHGDAGTLRLGAVATTVPGIDAVVAPHVGRRLGIPQGNALLVALEPGADTATARADLARDLGGAVVQPLGTTRAGAGESAARLVGGSVAEAVGSFHYRWHADGSVRPDPAWVAAHIVTAEVPILGRVTCHRVLVPQLRGALQAVVDAGLADAIDPGDYGGCYVPRFIDRDPARGLSLHTWGIAVDLNVSTNQLGTVGAIDRRVVDLFARWGLAWGGSWRRPDPMHFELAALAAPR